ncbi:hypothetical protein ABPG72_021975 [Tetrahymena utriculariae]
MAIFNLKLFFSTFIQNIDNLRLPYPFEQLNIKTKIIAIVCLTIIATSLALKFFKKLIILIKDKFQKVIQIRKNKQIKDISEMFDEKVNIQAESVDNLVHFMDKFQGKSLNQKYEQMNAFKQNPQSYSDANFAYKPRNFQLLERIRRENEERENQNDPNIANSYNRNGFNKMNGFANYSMANADQFNQNYNFNDNMHSQSMQQAPQQKFITAEDGLPSSIHNRNGIDLFSSPNFGQHIFKEDIQKPINRQNSVFFSFADEPQAFQSNIMQKQAEIYNKINHGLKSSDQKEMELEDHAPLVANTKEKQPQTIQNNVESQQIVTNKNETIEEENSNNNKNHKKKNEALKKVIKNKLICKNTKNKFIKPTKSSVAEKNEIRTQKDFKNISKKNQQVSLRQQQEEDDEDDYEEEDYDEEFIIYKKAKKLQAVPFKKQKKISKRTSQEEDFLINQSIQKQRKSNTNLRDLTSQSLNLQSNSSQQNKQQRNTSSQLSGQTSQQFQNNLLPQQAQQRQPSSQQIQQQQHIGLQTQQISQQQQQQQQIPQINQENQLYNLAQNQVQQEQIVKQQSQQQQQLGLLAAASQSQIVNQVEQQNTENSLPQGNSKETNSLCLPPPKNVTQKWNCSQNFSKKNLPFFNVEQFQHQNIEFSQKVGFNIYDEKNNKGYKAFVFNNQNSYIMPIDNNELENQEEKKEDKSVEGANNEEVTINQ